MSDAATRGKQRATRASDDLRGKVAVLREQCRRGDHLHSKSYDLSREWLAPLAESLGLKDDRCAWLVVSQECCVCGRLRRVLRVWWNPVAPHSRNAPEGSRSPPVTTRDGVTEIDPPDLEIELW